LDNVVDYLKKFENVTLVLSGHTDTKGPEAYNKVLSKKRAMSVQRILVAKGINKNRIDVKFFGEEQPLFPDYDENGNYLEEPAEKNRRVEIEVKLPK
jgi:OOP family OmpA-OmpF porin